MPYQLEHPTNNVPPTETTVGAKLGEFELLVGPSHIDGRPRWTRYTITHPAQSTIYDQAGVYTGEDGTPEAVLRRIVGSIASEDPRNGRDWKTHSKYPKIAGQMLTLYGDALAALGLGVS